VALVRKRTIPTERPPLVGEVSANILQVEGFVWSSQRIPTAVNLSFIDRSRYFFIQVALLSQLLSNYIQFLFIFELPIIFNTSETGIGKYTVDMPSKTLPCGK
jgi:hypothetical protein